MKTSVDDGMSAEGINLIVARARGGVIGHHGTIPWRLSEDLKYFKRITMGHALIMGRKTYESLPKKGLPGRHLIIVSRTVYENEERAGFQIRWCSDPESALASAYTLDKGPFVVGGAQIYAAFVDRASTLYITEIDRAITGDTYFPMFDESRFECVRNEPSREHPDVRYAVYQRKV